MAVALLFAALNVASALWLVSSKPVAFFNWFTAGFCLAMAIAISFERRAR